MSIAFSFCFFLFLCHSLSFPLCGTRGSLQSGFGLSAPRRWEGNGFCWRWIPAQSESLSRMWSRAGNKVQKHWLHFEGDHHRGAEMLMPPPPPKPDEGNWFISICWIWATNAKGQWMAHQKNWVGGSRDGRAALCYLSLFTVGWNTSCYIPAIIRLMGLMAASVQRSTLQRLQLRPWRSRLQPVDKPRCENLSKAPSGSVKAEMLMEIQSGLAASGIYSREVHAATILYPLILPLTGRLSLTHKPPWFSGNRHHCFLIGRYRFNLYCIENWHEQAVFRQPEWLIYIYIYITCRTGVYSQNSGAWPTWIFWGLMLIPML